MSSRLSTVSVDQRRLFFALWPPQTIRDRLSAVSAIALQACSGHPVPPANYHLTLAFLGACDAPDARFQALSALVFDSFELQLDRFGYWSRPKLVWWGPAHCPAPLTRLVAELRTGLTRLGIHYAVQQFRPHMTLVRKVPVFPQVEAPEAVRWSVNSFALIQSVTSATGAVYRPIRTFSGEIGAGSRHDPNQD